MTSEDPSSAIKRLTAAIASGDTEAFGRFYDRWFDWSVAEARRTTGRDESFCLDVVQDAMLRVIKSMKPLPHEAALYRWMRVVIRSCACDRLRADLRRRRREEGREEPGDPAAPEDVQARLAWLHEQLADMDAGDVEVLILRHRFGWTLARIGQALGMGHGAVDRRLRRIVGALRDRAKEETNGLSTF